jgi:hypothetical protein
MFYQVLEAFAFGVISWNFSLHHCVQMGPIQPPKWVPRALSLG